VLLAAEGIATRAIARTVGCTTGTASKWRVRYAEQRRAGLDETGKRGAAPRYTADTGKRILGVLDGAPPAGYARWTAPLIAAALGEVHEQYVWRFLRSQQIDLAGRKSWCVSQDPEFAAKAAEIVGLYLDPPEGALVVAVDEKPHIQALERAQGYLKLPNGRALGGRAHDYKRHGTSTLFAAFDVVSGEVMARHYKRRRRVEFLDFMNRIVATHPEREIHVILDNLNTHKPKRGRWLARHKNVHFHFTPTHASWLNQVECWFSILGGIVAQRRELYRDHPTQETHRCLCRQLQSNRPAVRLEQIRGSPKTPQTPFRGSLSPGTSSAFRGTTLTEVCKEQVTLRSPQHSCRRRGRSLPTSTGGSCPG
jgi:transposase